MRSSFVARALAFATLAAAGCDSGDGPDGPSAPPAPTTEAAPLVAGVPVVVANTAANPVMSQAVGTTAVAGSVTANQGGAWNVRVNNASLAVEGTVAVSGGTVAATQAGPWSVAVAAPVAIAPGASVAVSALPPVTLAGTPQVTLAGTPSVTLAGTPSVTIAGAAQALPITGAVTIANQPAVQDVRGTVEVARRQVRWDAVYLSQLGLSELPAGTILTDLTFSKVVPGGSCVVQLAESVDHGAGVRIVLLWRVDDEHPVATLHLPGGITPRNLAAPNEQFAIGLLEGGCTVQALWSGYAP